MATQEDEKFKALSELIRTQVLSRLAMANGGHLYASIAVHDLNGESSLVIINTVLASTHMVVIDWPYYTLSSRLRETLSRLRTTMANKGSRIDVIYRRGERSREFVVIDKTDIIDTERKPEDVDMVSEGEGQA